MSVVKIISSKGLEQQIDKFYRHDYRISTLLDVKRFLRVTSVIAKMSPNSVLDIGCGNCALLECLTAECKVGVDIYPYNIPEGIHFVLADAQHLPFRDGFFDVVSACEVLEHLQDVAGASSDMRRVIKSGGKMVVTLPNDTLIHLWGKVIRLLPIIPKKKRVSHLDDKNYHKHSTHVQKGNLPRRIIKKIGEPFFKSGIPALPPLPIFLPVPYSLSLFFLMVFKK